MSVNISVTAFGPKDDKFCKMEAIRKACEELGVQEPAAVAAYFGYMKETPEGVVCSMRDAIIEDKLGQDMLIDVSLIPKGATRIRVKLA